MIIFQLKKIKKQTAVSRPEIWLDCLGANISVVKTPSSILKVKISLNHILELFCRIQTPTEDSLTNHQADWNLRKDDDPPNFSQLEPGVCQPWPQVYAEFFFAQGPSWIPMHP